jgi:fibronectin type 3 domain-containing protein
LRHIPALVTDLSAIERGANIVVEFTIPRMTTEGTVLRQAPTFQLQVTPKGGAPKIVGEGREENGREHYRIPAAQWIGKEVAISVKAIGANGRDTGWSTPVNLTIVPPPVQPAELTAESAPRGVELTWKAPGDNFRVYRRTPDQQNFSLVAHSTKTEYNDTTAEFDKTYLYVVQAVAKAGEGEAESELSNLVSITPKNIFPPAAPAGLTAVPSTSTIELVWERNTDPDLAGYRVYRALGSGPFERISDTKEPPSYSDHQIESGKVYRYAVTAVKSNGLESKMSAPVEATAP